ncbi:glycosyltransferase family 1 protein, partial [bacterium]|nr:glycosyltransferase family 1 protein [bacterium]
VHYYMSNDIERERIARAGYERAIRDHTWQRRFEDFFNWLNI